MSRQFILIVSVALCTVGTPIAALAQSADIEYLYGYVNAWPTWTYDADDTLSAVTKAHVVNPPGPDPWDFYCTLILYNDQLTEMAFSVDDVFLQPDSEADLSPAGFYHDVATSYSSFFVAKTRVFVPWPGGGGEYELDWTTYTFYAE